ncbi:MAG: hypothetical protein HKM87_10825 [Ignavibacteriaceae bacterium]|nr:hypothetical protein [Ignavibacteriaceae bacterium]
MKKKNKEVSLLLRSLLVSVLLFTIILVFASYSFINSYSSSSIQNSLSAVSKLNLQNGDLIFRRGTSIESQVVLLTDKESEYSHVGMIYKINGEAYVLHTVPKENDDDPGYIKFESIEEFLSERKAARVGIYRLIQNFSEKINIASSYAYNCYIKNYRFDNNYDLESDKELYCTELIWKAYMQAGIDLVCNRLKEINIIVASRTLIMPSSIIESKLLKKTYSN